ncbi:hypothetical protein DDB_G0286801 [Dictyostelium discoideum AX4]|uniref:Uncharacterized protein n=1 Tax=Dictyostelium discoideum TaxID=44689 RepID=Q54LI6_DICDI|nr:hypothetical protein DDB_G0286801 [Dictyostelium discoideum AX4]EAL64156.1 hypothetical protein DDB_G0286801 [Dictyostelium discoideum AX4]|eukprot:XP_637575.1 hypothetical protein DDB_G0286801 [Dictyostelium discoideum AX4]
MENHQYRTLEATDNGDSINVFQSSNSSAQDNIIQQNQNNIDSNQNCNNKENNYIQSNYLEEDYRDVKKNKKTGTKIFLNILSSVLGSFGDDFL